MIRKSNELIFNYSGRKLLAKYLRSVVDVTKYDYNEHEVVVVDNAEGTPCIQIMLPATIVRSRN
jgi:hypothetical protein